jgi:hypothetical protein
MKDLYDNVRDIQKNGGTTEQQKEVILEVIELDNETVDNNKFVGYLFNRIKSCFGEHIVYLYEININDKETCLKYGYTVNEKRNFDGRYDKVSIVEEVKLVRLQAFGAVELEKELEERIPDHFRYTTTAKFPGKGELIDIKYKDDMIKLLDELAPKFKDVIGLKAPN